MLKAMLRRAATLAALVGALALPATPTQAGVADKLLETVKSELTGQIDHDQLEMADYAVSQPLNSATVFARASAQDYPFFALVGAVKAAKKVKHFGKLGDFTEDSCKSPITMIDVVFDKASSTISDQAGKAKTDAAVAQAKKIAAAYANAATNEAKQKLITELSETVPYFGDLPVICDFAFNTNFQAETDLQSVAGPTAQTVRDAYLDFQSGDLAKGVERLVGLGVNASIACKIVDDSVSGGLIAKTPVLGSLASGVCKSFVGKVFNGAGGLVEGVAGAIYGEAKNVLRTGEGLVKSGLCTLGSLFGDGCADDDPPPPPEPTAEENAAAAHAQLLADDQAYYTKNLPLLIAHMDKTWPAQCHSDACKTQVNAIRQNAVAQAQQASVSDTGDLPNQLLQIFAGANAEAQLVVVDFGVQEGLAPALAKFDAAYADKCDDDICNAGLKVVRLNMQFAVQQSHAAYPTLPFGLMFTPIQLANSQADDLVAESKERTASYNKATTAQAADAWQIWMTAVWGKRCSDALCVQKVAELAVAMRWETIALQANQPDSSSLNIQGQIATKFSPQFKALTVASAARAAAVLKAAQEVNAAAATAAARSRGFVLLKAVKDARLQRANWVKTHRAKPKGRPVALPAKPLTLVRPVTRPAVTVTPHG